MSSYLQRRPSISIGENRRRSLSDTDLSSQLQRKNQGLARENAVLREKCRLLEHKMQKLEKIELDSYPEKVESLVNAMKPIYEEMELFKRKLNDWQEVINQGLGDVLTAKPSKRTSVASFCRLSESERELHRRAAGNRLQDIALHWELSRITEASNASRARISTVSISGLTGRMSLVNVPASLDADDAVFDEECGIDPVNQSFHVPNHPLSSDTTDDRFIQIPAALSISSAAGDQIPLSIEAPEANPAPKTDEVIIELPVEADELTPAIDEKAVPKPKGRRKATTSRRPRAKKSDEVTSDQGSGDVTSTNIPPPRAEVSDELTSSVSSGQTLRPRRKGVNYRDLEENGPPATPKKPAKRTRKSPAVK